MIDTIKVKIDNLPINYLGTPLSHNKLKARDYGPLIEKINKKFNQWSSKQLNISGRCELIKTIIYLLTQFWLQFFQMPIISKINYICANFLWKS